MREPAQLRRKELRTTADLRLDLLALLIVLVLGAVLVLAIDGLLHHLDTARATWGPAW